MEIRGVYKLRLYKVNILYLFLVSVLSSQYIFPNDSFARELTEVTPVTAEAPTCSQSCPIYSPSNMCFEGTPAVQPAQNDLMACQRCQGATQEATQTANGIHSGNQGSYSAIQSAATASTGAEAGALGANVTNNHGAGKGVNNTGKNALAQQKALAKSSAEAFRQCADRIKSSCSGNLAQDDKGKAQEAENQCRQKQQESEQVAQEKQAAEDQAGKNENKAADNQEKNGSGSPPSPPPPPGGEQDETPKSPVVDNPTNVAPEKPKQLAGTSLSNNGMKEGIGIGSETGNTSNSGNPNSIYSSGISPASLASAEGAAPNSSSSNQGTFSSSGASGMGVSGGRGLGSSSSGAGSQKSASNPAEAANALAKNEEATAEFFSSPTSSGQRPALGISTTGDELTDLLKPAKLAAGDVGNIKLAQAGSGGRGETDTNLFYRVKSKLNKISIDRHMQ